MSFIKPKRPVSKVFIHCSASDNPKHDNVHTIKQWHLERGFNDIGYHFYIDKLGRLHKGRGLELIPAAQKGHNKGSIAICVGGLEKFTQSQLTTLYNFCSDLDIIYKGEITFHGHCEVEPIKRCPVFKYKEVLKLNAKGQMF